LEVTIASVFTVEEAEQKIGVKSDFLLGLFNPEDGGCIKNGVFCDVTPCGSFKNRRFGGT
jgi:hypothetical protein